MRGNGYPCPGYEVQIIDPETGASSRRAVPGEICVRGYIVMQGYYRKPEETARAIDPDGWLHTGDMGFLRADGRLRFLGRYKDMLKIGGENVDPMEVEGFLLAHPRINRGRGGRAARPAAIARCRWPSSSAAGARADRGGRHRALPRTARELQDPPSRRLRRRVPDDRARARSRR